MPEITITIPIERVQQAFKDAADEVFKSTYSNPVKDLLEEAVKDKSGEFKKVVDEIISAALTDPEFKKQVADTVIQRMVKAAMNER